MTTHPPISVTTDNNGQYRLIGLARLMRLAFSGGDLKPLAAELIAYANTHPSDANVLMDLSTILLLTGNAEVAHSTQHEALQMQQLYHLPATGPTQLRVLVMMAPGDLMANTPVEFLLENAPIALTMLYVGAGVPAPAALPEHDVLFVAIGESDDNNHLLSDLASVLQNWPQPVINEPSRIARLSRNLASHDMQDAAGIKMPLCVRLERQIVSDIGSGAQSLSSLIPNADYPIIIRPVGSHAGAGLRKIDTANALTDYLNDLPSAEFYLSQFVDYRSSDGQFRKYRIMLIDGAPFISHMGISSHWMIHYLNAGMTDSADKRAEEAAFMATFSSTFAQRHQAAFKTITARTGLAYVGIDCGETTDGKLLIFEIDSDMIVHAMDPTDLFPYKAAPMKMLFDAFQKMLGDRSRGHVALARD